MERRHLNRIVRMIGNPEASRRYFRSIKGKVKKNSFPTAGNFLAFQPR